MDHSDTFHKAYSSYSLASELIQNFAKKDRYSLGLRLETTLLEMIESVVTAEVTVDALKDRALITAAAKADVAAVLVRLALERKLIRETNYFALASNLREVAKMATGWRKTLTGRKS